MKEADLLKISLVISLLGLFLLALYSAKLVNEEKDVIDLRGIETGQTVKVSGIVKTIKPGNSSTSIQIQQTVTTRLVAFGPLDNIHAGDSIRAEGKFDENEGSSQIIVEKISKV